MLHGEQTLGRRAFVKRSAALALGGTIGGLSGCRLQDKATASTPGTAISVRTVLGPVAPDTLGVALMHEHAPVVDWSELYEVPVAQISSPDREQMLAVTVRQLDAFHKTLAAGEGPGAIVECSPIRVGRYPRLLVELARRTPVHIIACTGFWCEAFAPQHPWALRLGLEAGGVKKLAKLFIREITEGMEDPQGSSWGERFTDIKVGIIKCATSTHLRPSERRCHEAAAIASVETGCPITTHTTDGGGLEQAQLFLEHGVDPGKVAIGHQGNLDDRENVEANDYHRRIVDLGCSVQFDRVGQEEKYDNAKIARQVKALVDSGHTERVLLGHDRVPYFREDYTASTPSTAWKYREESDFTVVTTGLVEAMGQLGISRRGIRTILIDNPRRTLAF